MLSHLCCTQNYVHKLHTEYPVAHMVDQTETDTGCLYTGVYHILPSAIHLVEHREESDRMQLLNGTWKFQYFNSIYDIQDSFFEKNYDTENFDEIQVPSVWQMAGYDTHQYTNIRYPFPFDPPSYPFFWMPEYNRLWLALCFRAVRLDFHNNVVRS